MGFINPFPADRVALARFLAAILVDVVLLAPARFPLALLRIVVLLTLLFFAPLFFALLFLVLLFFNMGIILLL